MNLEMIRVGGRFSTIPPIKVQDVANRVIIGDSQAYLTPFDVLPDRGGRKESERISVLLLERDNKGCQVAGRINGRGRGAHIRGGTIVEHHQERKSHAASFAHRTVTGRQQDAFAPQ